MALQVIGAGFGRTGTMSFQAALNELGFGPCYHMIEVFGNDEHVAVWADAIAQRPVDWGALFADYGSTCDWPACAFWREQRERWPEAKVVLTTRDPDAWYRSFRSTILDHLDQPDDGGEADAARGAMTRALIEDFQFGGDLSREHVLAVLADHERAVIDTVPPDQLLVFDVAEGWEPLCAFLEVEVPATPFPRTNTTADFRTMAGLDPPA